MVIIQKMQGLSMQQLFKFSWFSYYIAKHQIFTPW